MNRRQRRRRAILVRVALFGPLGGSLALGLVGLAISPVHREETTQIYQTSPETIWGVLTDLDGMPAWRQDLVALERLPGPDGTVRWRETVSGRDPVTYQRTESDPPARLVVQVTAPGPGPRRWEYRIRSVDLGTELAVTEERSIGNPVLRPFVMLFGSDRDRIETFARELADRLKGHRRIAAALNR